MSDKVFDNILELPNSEVKEKAESLIGFENKFNRIHNNMRLLLDKEGLESWRQNFIRGDSQQSTTWWINIRLSYSREMLEQVKRQWPKPWQIEWPEN